MPILLKNPKTPDAFADKHTGGSIARQPKNVMAAQNEQLAKLSSALNTILKTAGITLKRKQ